MAKKNIKPNYRKYAVQIERLTQLLDYGTNYESFSAHELDTTSYYNKYSKINSYGRHAEGDIYGYSIKAKKISDFSRELADASRIGVDDPRSAGQAMVRNTTNFLAELINSSIEKNGLKFTLDKLQNEIKNNRGGIFRIMMIEYQTLLDQPDLNVTDLQMMIHSLAKKLNLKSGEYVNPWAKATSISPNSSGVDPDFSKIKVTAAAKLLKYFSGVDVKDII